MSAPYDTPDAVISGSQRFFGRPYGISGPGRLSRILRRLLRRKPISQRFLLRITYRDYKERCETIHFDPGQIRSFVDKLLAADTVRAVECAELLLKARKSFGADYDPANMIAEMNAFVASRASTGAGSVGEAEAPGSNGND